MKKKFILCAIFILIISIGTAGAAKSKKNKAAPVTSVSVKLITVNAEGSAPIVEGRKSEAREAARRELMRNALDTAIGSYVESVTKIENYKAVSDKVFSQSKGIVKQMNITNEWVDELDILHLSAECKVSEVTLDTVLGPAVIDALGNPRVMIMLEEGMARNSVQKIFEQAGYMIINPTQAQILKNIDLEAARAGGDYSRIRDVARDFHADVLIMGRSNAATVNKQRINGQMLYAVASTVRLEAVLSDTAQTIGSEEFSWRPHKLIDCSLSHGEGAAKGLNFCATKAATSIVNKVAYALTVSSNPTVKIIITDIDYKNARNLKDYLGSIQGVTGVYQRRYVNGSELEMDIVSDKTADDLASILSDKNYEITGVSHALVEGRKVAQ